MKRTNFFLPQRQVERLKALAKVYGLSVAELVRRAIDDLLKKEESCKDKS